MKPSIKAKWVKALLSGKFKQGTGAMEKNGKYCCLGVLRKVAIPEALWSEDNDLLSDGELIFVGLKQSEQSELANLNDGHQYVDDAKGVGRSTKPAPFPLIAGVIQYTL
jgi:hypothetical protein